jgi:predicted RNase H-like HicB family nuclease
MKTTSVKIIVEQHRDVYIAYPIAVKGIVLGQGATYDEAVSDLKSALNFHVKTFGARVLSEQRTILQVKAGEVSITV